MYTYVPKIRREDHRGRGDKPSMQIIDHRKRLQNRIISRSVPTEDLRYDEDIEDPRLSWFDAELGYKKRIKELEKEGDDMALALQEALTENRSLRNNINRGPTRTDVKKLLNEKKTMQNVIEKLGEENIELNEMLNRVIKRSESEWQDAYENIRRRQEERYSVIGPFLARIQGLKKRTVTMNDGPELNKDRYDAHLTNLEKETQALLNRLKQLKREKRFIDYSFVTGERKCSKNLKEFKEVGGNINRDIQKYTSHLEQLSEKHEEIIGSIQESRGLCDVEVQTELETETEPQSPELREKTAKNNSVKLPPIHVNDKRIVDRKRQAMEVTAKDGLIERQRTITKINDSSNEKVKNKKNNDNKIETSSKTYSPNSDKVKANDESTTSVPKTTNKPNSNGQSETEKQIMANQFVKKPPEDAGSIDMARLVSRTSMYTVLPKSEIPNHRKRADQPSLEVIDHRKKQKPSSLEESYEALRLQREALLDAERRYQKRIRELENEATETAKAQEATQTENKNLKNIIDRGPKVSLVRKAKLQNDQLQQTITKLLEENRDLIQLINRMEKRDEEEWKDVYAETRRRQEERYSVLGPFVAGLNGKKGTITLNDIPKNKKVDNYDRQLETLSKETKKLLHKFEQMKRAKLSIDYATVMGPKKSMKNINKHRAIGDLINLDLNKYAARLEDLTAKHGKLTGELITSLSKECKKGVNLGQKQFLLSSDSKDEARGRSCEGKKDDRKDSFGGTRLKTSSAPLTDMSRKNNNRNAKSDTEIEDNYAEPVRVKRRKRKVKSASTESMLRGPNNSVESIPKGINSRSVESSKRNIQSSDKSVRFLNETKTKQENKMPRHWSEENFDRNNEKLINSQAVEGKRSDSKNSSSLVHPNLAKQSELHSYKENKSSSQKDIGQTKNNLSNSSINATNTAQTPKSNDLNLIPRLGADTEKKISDPLDLARRHSRTHRETRHSTGKYSHGPETIDKSHSALIKIKGPEIEIDEMPRKQRQERYESKLNSKQKRRESKSDLHSAKSSSTFKRTFPKNPPITKDSIHLKKAPNSAVVLQYLKQNNKSSSMEFNELFLDHEEQVPEPVPVTFRDDAKTLRRRNIRFVTQTDQKAREIADRREMFYRNFLNEL